MRILVIAGHGDGDSGAVGNGYRECDLTRELARLVYREIRLNTTAVSYLYDVNKNCYKECKKGNAPEWRDYDLIVEFHFNSASDKSANGTETLLEIGEDTRLGEYVLAYLEQVGFRNRGVRTRDNLLNPNVSPTYYLYLETCFISNSNDVKLYQSKKSSVAHAVVKGIQRYFNIPSKETGDNETSTGALYKVQTGAFKEKANAEKLAEELKTKGYATYIVEG